jgi:hypothetical protein
VVKLQCLGVALGDALAEELQMEWVTVEDEYGKDPALRFPGTTVIAFPLTMISKSDRARRKGGRCRAVRRSL